MEIARDFKPRIVPRSVTNKGEATAPGPMSFIAFSVTWYSETRFEDGKPRKDACGEIRALSIDELVPLSA